MAKSWSSRAWRGCVRAPVREWRRPCGSTSSGVRAVTCRLEAADQLPLDQENGLVVEVAEELPVLFVESREHASDAVTAGELFSAALGFKAGEAQTWHAVYRPEVIPAAALATHPLADYRAIVINDVPEFDNNTLERLDAFVRAGGGLWLAVGEATDPAIFRRDWYSDGAGLAPLPLDSLEVVAKADDPAATVHPPSRDHPATIQLANTTQLDIDEARLRQYWRFTDKGPDQQAVSALFESGSGQPLVVENFVGEGRVLVQAFPLGLEWSNVPLLKAYVVMVQDWLGFVTSPTTSRYNLEPGGLIVASPPADAAGATAELVTPRGRAIPLAAVDADFAPVFRYSQTTLPGMYRVRFKEGRRDGWRSAVSGRATRGGIGPADARRRGAGEAGDRVWREVRRDGGGRADGGRGGAAAGAGVGDIARGAGGAVGGRVVLGEFDRAAAAWV